MVVNNKLVIRTNIRQLVKAHIPASTRASLAVRLNGEPCLAFVRSSVTSMTSALGDPKGGLILKDLVEGIRDGEQVRKGYWRRYWLTVGVSREVGIY